MDIDHLSVALAICDDGRLLSAVVRCESSKGGDDSRANGTSRPCPSSCAQVIDLEYRDPRLYVMAREVTRILENMISQAACGLRHGSYDFHGAIEDVDAFLRAMAKWLAVAALRPSAASLLALFMHSSGTSESVPDVPNDLLVALIDNATDRQFMTDHPEQAGFLISVLSSAAIDTPRTFRLALRSGLLASYARIPLEVGLIADVVTGFEQLTEEMPPTCADELRTAVTRTYPRVLATLSANPSSNAITLLEGWKVLAKAAGVGDDLCVRCGETSQSKCNKCGRRYCSRICAVDDWKRGDHRALCRQSNASS